MILWCSKKEKFFKFFFSYAKIQIMVIAMSMVSSSGILEKGKFLERFALLIWETKVKVSMQE